MDRAGTVPKSLIDLAPWSPLFAPPGPVLSLVLATPAATEQAAQKNDTRWGDERRRLEAEGLPAAVADRIGEVVLDAHRYGEGLAVFAHGKGILHVAHSPVPPRSEIARWDTLPSISPLLDWMQHQPPYLVVAIDHEGADLMASGSGTPDTTEEAGTAHRYPVAVNHPGGWSQRHYQKHAVENWARSAREVAAAVVALPDRVDPQVVMLGGDPRSVSLLRQALPGELEERVREVSITRAADGEGDQSARQVARLVETSCAEETVAAMEEFRMHLGRGDRAVEGVEPTLAALREGRVAALLFHDDPDDDRRAWFGSEPGTVAVRRSDLEGVGGGPAGEGRMVDVALRAASATSAAARILPGAGGPAEGIGALLRWAD